MPESLSWPCGNTYGASRNKATAFELLWKQMGFAVSKTFPIDCWPIADSNPRPGRTPLIRGGKLSLMQHVLPAAATKVGVAVTGCTDEVSGADVAVNVAIPGQGQVNEVRQKAFQMFDGWSSLYDLPAAATVPDGSLVLNSCQGRWKPRNPCVEYCVGMMTKVISLTQLS